MPRSCYKPHCCRAQVLKIQKHDRHRDRETALQLYKWLDEREKARLRR